jgi:nephrocystin-3
VACFGLQYVAVAASRRIRIFVSSTFQDMMAERNLLMTHAWPELRRFCRQRQVDTVEVDLRWGISEEQSTRKETLKLCLDEIRASRPYFVGILGERYGWIPGDESFTPDLLEEQPWLDELRDRSLTELEIVYGVLRESQVHGRAFFYFREPGSLGTVPADVGQDSSSEPLTAGTPAPRPRRSGEQREVTTAKGAD